jgi:hypothetical protein
MSRRIKKSMPILIVGAILGFLCWPYLEEKTPRPKEVDAVKPLKTLVAALSPPPAPPPARDPFDSRATERPGRRGKKQTAKTPGKGGNAAEAGKTVAAGSSLPRAPSELSLQATHLRGERRIALINGAVYAEGDEIKPTGPNAVAYTVTRIYPHRVVLESEDQKLELMYPTHDAKPGPGPRGTARDIPGKSNTTKSPARKAS